MTDQEIRDIVFMPNDAVNLALRTIEERRTEKGVGVRVGIPCIDKYLLPGRPGEFIGVLGRTSNYKTGFMQYWARQAAEQLAKGEVKDKCVVYVTWEQAIEEVVAFDLAATAQISATDLFAGETTDAMMDTLRYKGFTRATKPLCLIGHSLTEGKARPHLTLTTIGRAFNFLKNEYGLMPYIVFLDYLQQIDPGPGEDRRIQVFYNVSRCKDMALALACPVVCASQTGRITYDDAWGIPPITGSLESSNFEHTCDKFIGVWMPKTTMDEGETLKLRGTDRTVEVTDNLLIMAVLKQKFGPAGKYWPLYVDPARNIIGEMAGS